MTLRKLNRGAIRRLRGARGAQGLQGPPGPPGGAGGVGSGVVGPDNLSSSIPSVRVTHSLPQPIEPAGGISDPLQFDEERWDTAAMHGPATNTRLTAPVAGVYLITANIEWSGEDFPEAVNGSRTVVLMRNGNAVIAQERIDASDFDGTGEPQPGPQNTVQALATQAQLDPGDYVEVLVHHSQNEELTISSFSKSAILESSPEFAMTWLAPGPG